MNTLLGTTYQKPTPEEVQALIRQANYERAQVMRRVFAALFSWWRKAETAEPHEHGSLRPAT